MSVAREVDVQYDLKVLGEVARELGYMTATQQAARGWYGTMNNGTKCDLVITSKAHRFDMGFVKQPDGKTKMYADFHGGHVQADMADKIIPRYLEKMTQGRMKIANRAQTHKHVVLTMERS